MKKKKVIGLMLCVAIVLTIGIILWNENRLTEDEVAEVLEDGKFFVEQSYNGIYEISKEDYEKISSYSSKVNLW